MNTKKKKINKKSVRQQFRFFLFALLLHNIILYTLVRLSRMYSTSITYIIEPIMVKSYPRERYIIHSYINIFNKLHFFRFYFFSTPSVNNR